jgi:hypothetical protein
MMETCKFCGETSAAVVDGICDGCEPLWLDQLSQIVPGCVGDTAVGDLFGRVDTALFARKEMLEKLDKGGPVPVYRYEFGGQNVRYLLLGEFVLDELYHTVVCTLESGKGSLRRTGLHTMALHHACPRTDAMQAADATSIVSRAVGEFPESSMSNAHEVLRVARAAFF